MMGQQESHNPYKGKTPSEVIDKGAVIGEVYDTELTPEQRKAWERYWQLLFARVFKEADTPSNDGKKSNEPSPTTELGSK
jgi:hypothetical protein